MAAEPTSGTRIVLQRAPDPFQHLDDDERRRLLVRVLCGLVAYGEPEDLVEPVDELVEHRLAG